MIQRIFHPVGQGAFYSERHENHNIVYDCGTYYFNRGKKEIKKVVQKSFNNEIIDILFISHFDYDHISLIEDLKTTVKEIRFVVIPLLHNNEKIFLSNVFKALGEYSLASLVDNPNKFFGAKTHIINILPYPERKKTTNSEERKITNIEPINLIDIEQNQKIPSGTPITIDNDSDWVFIPFNYKYKDRNKEFLNLLKKDYVDNVRNKTNYILDSNIRKKIKSIYTKISGKINQNSMFLYSGPYEKNSKCYQGVYWDLRLLSAFSTPSKHPFPTISKYSFIKLNKYPLKDSLPCQYKVACLYTGDGDLNKVDIEKIYRDYWNLIGTIQIPHHGSLKSFNESILKDQYFLCPISVGENNSYGHPSGKVISKILSYASFPLLVTEDTDSEFIETIKKINN
jgi:hypothetical protein